MGDLLKFLSIITGSSESQLLQLKAKYSPSGEIACNADKEYVFDLFTKTMASHKNVWPGGLNIVDDLNIAMSFIGDTKNASDITTINRVLHYYYNYDVETSQSLYKALTAFGCDFINYREKCSNGR